MTDVENAEIVTLSPDSYGYESKAAVNDDSLDDVEVEEMPIIKLEEWLSPDAVRPTKWVKLPSRQGKILIQAMTQKEFKSIRDKAPMTVIKKGQQKKTVKNEEWIQTRVILDNVLKPKITDASLLENALAGDIAYIVVEITKLSGFDVDGLMRDALEL